VPLSITWEQALAWRMRRHLLDPVGRLPVADVVARLCGVQAQVAGSAELAIRVRRERSQPGEVARALEDGRLVKTWAMRGTLHVLRTEDAGAFLSLMAAGRSWEKPSWERYFDQYVLGPGTRDRHVVPAARRAAVSRPAGWLSPVVVAGGVVRGTWELVGEQARVAWFREGGRPPRAALRVEVERLSALLDREPPAGRGRRRLAAGLPASASRRGPRADRGGSVLRRSARPVARLGDDGRALRPGRGRRPASSPGIRNPLHRKRDPEQRHDAAEDDAGDLKPAEHMALADPERVRERRHRRAGRAEERDHDPQRSLVHHVASVPALRPRLTRAARTPLPPQ
jgi:hypothetical protein